jgi:hypothetical protein
MTDGGLPVPRTDGDHLYFVVAVVACSRAETDGGSPGDYGEARSDWRAFGDAEAPLAVRAAAAATRLGLPVRIVDLVARPGFDRTPGLILIDPFCCDILGEEALRGLIGGLPGWVTAVVVFDQLEEHEGGRGSLLAQRTADMIGSIGSMRVVIVKASEEFAHRVPRLVLDARQQFLRNAPVFPPTGPATPRPRFSVDPRPPSSAK